MELWLECRIDKLITMARRIKFNISRREERQNLYGPPFTKK